MVCLVALGATAPAGAQTDACLAALMEAEARYVEGSFDAVARGLDPCLDRTDAAVPALRLMALAHLRLGQITDAKLSILRILAVRPDYAASPIQDPPTYVALVTSVRRQLDAASGAAVASALIARGPWERTPRRPVRTVPVPERPPVGVRVDPVLPGEAPPRVLPLAVSVWGGVGSYGGERGIAAPSIFEAFSDNAGLSGGFDIEARVLPRLSIFGAFEVGHFPTLPTRKGPHPAFDEVDSFSAWLQFVTVGARAVPVRQGPIGLTLTAGGGLGVGRRDGAARTAGLLTAASGVEATVSPANRLFVEVHGALTFPGRAIDGAAHADAPPDAFSGLRIGLRSRIR